VNFNTGQSTVISTISYGNAVTGFKMVSGLTQSSLINCAAGGNATDYDVNLASYQKIACLTLTATPFTNAAGNDFSLNTTAAAVHSAAQPASLALSPAFRRRVSATSGRRNPRQRPAALWPAI
jgi:hypothetical protein